MYYFELRSCNALIVMQPQRFLSQEFGSMLIMDTWQFAVVVFFSAVPLRYRYTSRSNVSEMSRFCRMKEELGQLKKRNASGKLHGCVLARTGVSSSRVARLSLSDLINALISVHVKYMIDTYINSSLIVGLCEYLHCIQRGKK